jgi:hypothetical protein
MACLLQLTVHSEENPRKRAHLRGLIPFEPVYLLKAVA